MTALKYLAGYPDALQQQVRDLIAADRLGPWLERRYAELHTVRNDRQLYDYTQALKERYLRQSVPLSKVVYDSRLQVLKHALGTHTTVSALLAALDGPQPLFQRLPGTGRTVFDALADCLR